MQSKKVNIFWFRRDLRLHDNAGLYKALVAESEVPVKAIFIFDQNILKALNNPDDKRVPFIHQVIKDLKEKLQQKQSDLTIYHGKPEEVFRELIQSGNVCAVYTNHDYEPAARKRDEKIKQLCEKKGVSFHSFKDQVIFEENEVLTAQRNPYTIYTPYKKTWLQSLSPFYLKSYPTEKYLANLLKDKKSLMPSLRQLGFSGKFHDFPSAQPELKIIQNYDKARDIPSLHGTSRLGLHLRFGTVSIREMVVLAKKQNATWLSELIWREFFMQILFHFPHVEHSSFRPQYEKVQWLDSKKDFERWTHGETGYPLVDAGMRELNATGFMHNRVRMVTASFLTKHLLQHWLQGERYFAKELLDYDLAANNGNWQWAAGTGCDAAPYFRVFNPETQMEKFDPDLKYVKQWVPEFGSSKYPAPMVEHKFARDRALKAFAKALKGKTS